MEDFDGPLDLDGDGDDAKCVSSLMRMARIKVMAVSHPERAVVVLSCWQLVEQC